MIDANTAKSGEAVATLVPQAVSSAAEKAAEVQNIIGAWSDNPGNLGKNEANTDLLALVRKSPVLKDISKYLGRFREIFAQGKHNGYAYGRGEKYSLELGRDLSPAITSELLCWHHPRPHRFSFGSTSRDGSSSTSAGSRSTRVWAMSSAVWMSPIPQQVTPLPGAKPWL